MSIINYMYVLFVGAAPHAMATNNWSNPNYFKSKSGKITRNWIFDFSQIGVRPSYSELSVYDNGFCDFLNGKNESISKFNKIKENELAWPLHLIEEAVKAGHRVKLFTRIIAGLGVLNLAAMGVLGWSLILIIIGIIQMLAFFIILFGSAIEELAEVKRIELALINGLEKVEARCRNELDAFQEILSIEDMKKLIKSVGDYEVKVIKKLVL